MPLNKSTSEEAFHENVAELIKAGHSKEQALAISHKIQRGEDCGMDDISARKYDSNGWAEIKDNPISRTGVFPYLGKQIDASLDPEKIYMVYRPQEELSNQDTIDSFKLIPWVNLHPLKLLGPKEAGRMPAEEKGIEGVIGENVYFDGEFLRGNIKLFSDNLQDIVDSGEAAELSCGFGCKYKLSSGIFNGIQYDAIQHTIRGNHLASVPEGRMGPEVAVLDHLVFTFDAKDIQMPKNEEEMKKEKEAADKKARDESEKEEKEKKEAADKAAKDAEEKEEKEKKEAADKMAKDKEDEEKEEKKEAADRAAMDAQIKDLRSQVEALKSGGVKAILGEIAQRDALASKLSQFVGAFDCSDKTLAEVAAYGMEKLGLKAPKGHEQTALDAYFTNRKPHTQEIGFALDTGSVSNSNDAQDFYNKAG